MSETAKNLKLDQSQEPKSKKKGFQLPHVYIIFLIVMLLVVGLSWIVPSGEYARVADPNTGAMIVDPTQFASGVEAKPITVFDYFKALHNGVVESAGIIVMLLLASGSIHLLNKSGAMGAGIQALIRVSGGKEIGIMLILAFVFTLMGTIGLGEGGIPFIPLVVSVAVGLGFDRVTGFATYGAGMMAGFTAGVANFYSTGISQMLVGLPLYSGMTFRIISLLVFFVITAVYLVSYAKKIKKDPNKSVMAEDYKEQLATVKHAQEDASASLEFTTRRKLALFGLAATFIINAYGPVQLKWGIPEMSAVWVMFAIVLVFILRLNPSQTAIEFGKGAGAILPAALAIGFARSVVLLMNQAKIVDTAVHGLASSLQGQSAIVTLLLVFLSVVAFNFFVVSASGKAMMLMPILGPLAQILKINQQVMVTLYQFGDGISNQLWPTSGALMAGLAMVKIDFKAWFKYVWKLQIVLHIAAFILVYIAHLTNYGPF
ncbi:YfcC family protein [Acidaminobacter hydrogenoformans]|uniref:Uncharacterized membrane protein YfcC, ion transporter superfamily n=1 Tax=Acidaminobacter hydrogenoformans DSM 2784 TaxID=1120920 RepID=A0A1G5RYQ8_9FIRM|nr:YfcC family protein [Acidaminobacter hydrogenoformans]SCZ78581.1 Uncharacterized membrane protein YfcC, ion transporter superfamily [Acidaminobacter hydrogenoformans DSM 2784]